MLEVTGNHATPEPDVDVYAAARGVALRHQGRVGGGRRNAVERHVDQRGDAARRGGSGAGWEALPVGTTGVVELAVAVDQARQLRVLAYFEKRSGWNRLVPRADRGDLAVAHVNRGRRDAIGKDYASAAQ